MTGTTGRKLFSAATRWLVAAVLAAGVVAAANAAEYQLYFLGGQSNMEGYGYTAELDEQYRQRSGNVMIFAGQWAFDNQPYGGIGIWAPLQPGHGVGFRTNGELNRYSSRFGPELLFGQTMATLNPDAKIAIVKYALGGTGLSVGVGYANWFPDFSVGNGINQYDHALNTLHNALSHTDIDGDGVADTLVPGGIVWMQGEADAEHSQKAADAYGENLEQLMNLLRSALQVDDLPVVVGKVTDSGMAADGKVMDYIATVQRGQREFAESDACAAYVTVTDDISHLPDAWHYDTDGVVRLGTAFAEAMVELEARCGHND
jgi:hypothetical protein